MYYQPIRKQHGLEPASRRIFFICSLSSLHLSLVEVWMVFIIWCSRWLLWHCSSLSFLNKVKSQLSGRGTSAGVLVQPLADQTSSFLNFQHRAEDLPGLWRQAQFVLMVHKAVGVELPVVSSCHNLFLLFFASRPPYKSQVLVCFYPQILHFWTYAEIILLYSHRIESQRVTCCSYGSDNMHKICTLCPVFYTLPQG